MTPDAFTTALPRRGVLCGLDLGRKTIGLAFSASDWSFAGPDIVIRRGRQAADLAALRERLEARETVGLVLGMPLNMDGSSGPSAQRSRAFARTLEGEFDLPLLLWDERLSSEAAAEDMAAAGIGAAKRRERIDAYAAAHILRGAIDALTCPPGRGGINGPLQ